MDDDKTSSNASRRVTIHSIDAILRSEKAETIGDERGQNQVYESKKIKSTDMDIELGETFRSYLNLTRLIIYEYFDLVFSNNQFYLFPLFVDYWVRYCTIDLIY